MALIQVTPELLESKASEVRALRANHDNTMTKLKNLVHSLDSEWKGEAQAAFVASFEGMQATFTNFSQMLEDYAVKMVKSAQIMRDADAQGGNLNKA